MLNYTFTIENTDTGFLLANSQTLPINEYPSFNIYNYARNLVKPDLLFVYTTVSGKSVYKLATENINLNAITTNNEFYFTLFTTSSLLTVSLNLELLDSIDLYIENKKIEKTTELFILPKYRAIPCKIYKKVPFINLQEIIFTYPIYLKSFTTLWSIS